MKRQIFLSWFALTMVTVACQAIPAQSTVATIPSLTLQPNHPQPSITRPATDTPLPALTPTAVPIITRCAADPSYGDQLTLKPAERSGWCEVSVPLEGNTTGYTLVYPENWKINLVGAEEMNLCFTTNVSSGGTQEIFLRLTLVNGLPLERVDEATYSYELSGPDLLVDPAESRVSREIRSIEDKQVLVLLTTKESSTVKRYFLVHGKSLYMFEIETPSVDSNQEFVIHLYEQVEEMIASMHFLW